MIPPEAFTELLAELDRRPLDINKYRLTSGVGRSQTFGVVNRRCLPPDYSRQNWRRPYLYKLLLDFAAKYVSIPFTSITFNQNYAAAPHRDKGNEGDSLLVAFGNYEGGELVIHEGDLSGTHSVRYAPISTDFSKVLHSVKPFTGNRYSLVFYTIKNANQLDLPPQEVVQIDDKWRFKRGAEIITNGLPHPIREFHKRLKQKPAVV